MVMVVVVINTLISGVLLYVAWRIWQLKQRIGRIADKLAVYERCTHAVLYQAPENIYTSQQKIENLRQKNQALQVQIQQVRQILNLLVLGRQIWRRLFNGVGVVQK